MFASAVAVVQAGHSPRGRWLQRHRAALGLLLMASALLLLAAPARAQANTYDVVGCNEAPVGEQNKQPFSLFANIDPAQVIVSNQCPFNGATQFGVYLRNNHANVCNTCGAFAQFIAPSGTVITGAAIDRQLSPRPSEAWDYMAIDAAGTKLDGCRSTDPATCLATNGLGPAYTDIADTTSFNYHIICRDTVNGCQEVDTSQPWIRISRIRIRISDTTNPTISGVGGTAWTSSPINGTKTVTATGSDVTGIRFSKLEIDGQDVTGSTQNYTCDYTTATPCTAGGAGTSRAVSHSLDTTQFSDGNHTLTIVVADTSGNTVSDSQSITIDNTGPNKPTITDKPSSITTSNNAIFEFVGAEPGGSFQCRLDGSGSFSSCTSPKSYPSLSGGAHLFEVRQLDGLGNVGQTETYAWTIHDLPGEPAIGGCQSPTATLADGYAGDTYVTVRHQDADDQQWICISTANPQVSLAGKLIIVAGEDAGQPDIDNSPPDVCANEPNDLVPPHPPLEATVGDGVEVPQVHVKVEPYANTDEAWACVRVREKLGADEQTFDRRVILPLPDGGEAPTFDFQPYDVQPVPAPEPGPVGYASSTCRQAPGGEYERVVNMDLTDDDTHLWVDTRQPSDDHAQLCTRIEGAAGVGGMFDVNADGAPGVSAVQDVDDDTSRCNLLVLDVPALGLLIQRTAATANPASVCVDHTPTNTHKSVTVGTQGSADPPAITWTPDTGTPGGPIGPLP